MKYIELLKHLRTMENTLENLPYDLVSERDNKILNNVQNIIELLKKETHNDSNE